MDRQCQPATSIPINVTPISNDIQSHCLRGDVSDVLRPDVRFEAEARDSMALLSVSLFTNR